MPFVEINIEKEIDKRIKESDSFAKVWDENQEEYRLIGEMISLRKAEKSHKVNWLPSQEINSR